jgi:hypothetical protein
MPFGLSAAIAVMGLLYMGASQPGASCANSVLSVFVDRDAEFILGEVLQSAERFLNRNSGRNQQ